MTGDIALAVRVNVAWERGEAGTPPVAVYVELEEMPAIGELFPERL